MSLLKRMGIIAAFCIIMSGCSKGGDNSTLEKTESEIKKPEEIVMLTNTIKTTEEGMKVFADEYEKRTGIKMTIKVTEHHDYYETVNILIAASEQLDCIEVGSVFYPSYAMYDLLWDMTDSWNNSEIKPVVDESYVDALKIDGRLYGFPLSKGNGTITYVRGDWLDNLSINPPKNYSEFYEMLKKFKAMGDNYIPITAAGLMNSETPYALYLREFYQDAVPDFTLKDGKYVDGMTEPQMVKALERMKTAYKDGLIDKDIATNKTSTCREKFNKGLVGCFNYWAGSWNMTLQESINENVPDAKVVPIPSIEETKYIERPPLAMVIPISCKNPEGVFKYLIEYSHDGGEGELLFTSGVEGYHWRQNSDGTQSDIKEHLNAGKAGTYFAPELTFTTFKSKIPLDERIINSEDIFMKNSTIASIPLIRKETGSLLPEVDLLRREIIEDIVTTDMTIEEGLSEYERRGSKTIARILKNLNEEY